MKRLSILAAASILMIGPTFGAEWWEDAFVWEGSGSCEGNDSISTYRGRTVEMWEASCTISQKTALRGLEGIIFDLDCTGVEGDPPWKSRELLLKLPDGGAASFPPLKKLTRCSSLKDSPPTARQCDFDSRVFRSEANASPDDKIYQEVQFSDGMTLGTVTLTEFLDGRPQWTASGQHTCSNGASICRVEFPLMLGQPVDVPYEIVDDNLLVMPSLRQNVYQGERYAVMNGKNYGGLVADLLGGFVPKENELLLPHNVYRYSDCRPKRQ